MGMGSTKPDTGRLYAAQHFHLKHVRQNRSPECNVCACSAKTFVVLRPVTVGVCKPVLLCTCPAPPTIPLFVC